MADPDGLSPVATPGRLKAPAPKWLSKKPVIALGVLFITIMLVLAYSIAQRGKITDRAAPEQEARSGSVSSANEIIQSYNQPYRVPEQNNVLMPAVEPFSQPEPKPAPKPLSEPKPKSELKPEPPAPPVLSEEEQFQLERRRRIQAQREQLLLAALTSKTASAEVAEQEQAGEARTAQQQARQRQLAHEQARQQLFERSQGAQAQAPDLQNIERLLMAIAQNTAGAESAGTTPAIPPSAPSAHRNNSIGQGARLVVPAPVIAGSATGGLQQPSARLNARTAPSTVNASASTAVTRQPPPRPVVKLPTTPVQAEKLAQLKQNAPPGTFTDTEKKYGYSSEAKRAQLTQYDLRVGTIIPAIMISGISSDLPGEVVAQVSQDVFDSTHGAAVVIPQGARLIGSFTNAVSFGQERIAVAWDRLQFPNGETLALGSMQGADQGGFPGFKDEVNNHYFKTFAGATLLSLISGLAQSSQSDNNAANQSSGETLAGAIGQQYAEVGTELVQRNLDVAPTIEIRPGYRFSIILNKDIVLDAYR